MIVDHWTPDRGCNDPQSRDPETGPSRDQADAARTAWLGHPRALPTGTDGPTVADVRFVFRSGATPQSPEAPRTPPATPEAHPRHRAPPAPRPHPRKAPRECAAG